MLGRPLRRGGALLAVAVCAAVCAAACTTDRVDRTFQPKPTPSSAAAGRCEALPAVQRPDLLSLADVWGSGNGGHATTVLDLRGCAKDAFSSTNFVCHLSFPWLSGANEAPQLAAMGAERVTVRRVVAPAGEDVTETVVEFGPGARPGGSALHRQAVECGGRPDRHGDELAAWTAADGQPTWAIRSSGPTIVAVTFTESGLDRRRQQAVMDLAFAKAVGSRP